MCKRDSDTILASFDSMFYFSFSFVSTQIIFSGDLRVNKKIDDFFF